MPYAASRLNGTAIQIGSRSSARPEPTSPVATITNAPMPMPPNAACARPSPRKLRRRWTTNTPSRPVATAISTPATRARCRKGSAIASRRLTAPPAPRPRASPGPRRRRAAQPGRGGSRRHRVLVEAVPERLPEPVALQHLFGRPERRQAAVDDEHAVGVEPGRGHVVGDHHDGRGRAGGGRLLAVRLEEVVEVVL